MVQKTHNLDPKNVNTRLYNQVAALLDDLESGDTVITVRERITALVAIGRIQTLFVGLRKENRDEPNAGSSVRKYAGAFAANAVSRRAKSGGRSAHDLVAELDAADDDDAA